MKVCLRGCLAEEKAKEWGQENGKAEKPKSPPPLSLLCHSDPMHLTKLFVAVVFVTAAIFWSGCDHNGIIVEYHIPSKLDKLIITADEVHGEDVLVKNGIAKVHFDKEGFARIKTFDKIDRWAQDIVVLNGQKLSQSNVEVEYVELKLNYIHTRLPGGGMRSESIENGTSKIYGIRYK